MATSTPKFDPFNPSAYTAPELPQVQTPTPTAAMAPANTPPPQQPAIGPGKVGSAALIADQVMRGFASGLAQGQMARAQKLQKTSQALQSSYGLAAKNLTDVVQQYNVTPQQLGAIQQGKTPPPGADGKPLDDSAIKALQSASSAVQGSWGAWTQWQGQHIDPQKSDKKGGKGKKDQSQQQPQGNPLQNAIRKVGEAMRGNDPAAVSQAVYQFWVANGPPVYHSLDAQMAQAGQRGAQEKLQSTETGNQQAVQDAIATRNKYAGVDPSTLKPEDQAHLKSAIALLDENKPPSTKTPKGLKVMGSETLPLGLENQDTGQQYLPSQLGSNGNAPPEYKEAWKTLQEAKTAKQAEEDKKEDERIKHEARVLGASFERMGMQQQFSELMAQYRSDLGTYRALNKTAEDSEALVKSLEDQYHAPPGSRAVADNMLQNFYTTVVQKGGRKTAAELALTTHIGDLETNLKQKVDKITSGELPQPLREALLNGMKAVAQEQREEADKAKPELPQVTAPHTAWKLPDDAPAAPKENGKVLKADGKVIAKSKGGRWVEP